MSNEEQNAYAGEEPAVDLMALITALWQGKWIVIGSSVLTGIVAVIIAISLPNIYRSETTLVPIEKSGSGDLESLSARFGGLASFAGLDIGNQSADTVTVALATLKSRKFLSEFVKNRDILAPLIAVNAFNSISREITFDPDLFDSKSGEWVRDVDPPKSAVPSDLEAYKTLAEILLINEDDDTGLVQVALEHQSPVLAQQWLEWLIEDVNSEIRDREVRLAEKSIQFLMDEIERTPVAEAKLMLYGLVEEQMHTVMLAGVLPEYALRTVDPPVVPEDPVKPNRIYIVILGLFAGFAVSSLIVIVRAELRAGRRRTGAESR